MSSIIRHIINFLDYLLACVANTTLMFVEQALVPAPSTTYNVENLDIPFIFNKIQKRKYQLWIIPG